MKEIENEVLQRITRLETKDDEMDEKLNRAIKANETSVEALQYAKSAHRRLDQIEDNQKWLWRTFAGAIILAVSAFIVSGGIQ